MSDADYLLAPLIPAAEQGDVQTQYKVACIYLNLGDMMGRDMTSEDVQKGMKWMHRAVKQGYWKAMETLGLIYIRGAFLDSKLPGVTRNIQEGLEWCLRAIILHPNAENIRYLENIIRDYFSNLLHDGDKSFLPELRKSAEQGNPLAQGYLGLYYDHYYIYGEEDIPEARKWLSKAAEHGMICAKDTLKSLENYLKRLQQGES